MTSATVAPTISTAIFGTQDRIPRHPLPRWAAELRARLRRSLREDRTAAELSETVGGLGNNAALIAAQRGDGAAAWRLCERQMWWQHRLSRRARDGAVAFRCVQPWVNLARIEAMTGRCDQALERLRPLGVRRPGAGLALSPARGDGLGCQPIPHTDAESEMLLENIYVLDTLKALLQNRRWEEAAAFAGRLEADGRGRLALWGQEAAVVAACRLEDFDRAEAIARAALRRDDVARWDRAAFVLRLAEVLACAGDVDGARAALARLAAAAAGLSEAGRGQLEAVYLLARVAAACAEVGMDGAAVEVARVVHQGATAADDETMRIEALRILAQRAPAAERVVWEEALDALENSTGYRRYRRPDAPPADGAVFEALYAELEAVFAA